MTAKPWDINSEHLLRELAPQVLGAVIRRFRDFTAAEDAVQEALLAAAVQWPREGVPDNPGAWLITVASRRITDYLRSEVARRRRETAAAMEMDQLAPPADVEKETDQEDTLILLFMCCHPALTPSSAIALTLRAVGGLRRQIRSIVSAEALLIALIGLVIGIALGAGNLYYALEIARRQITGVGLSYQFPWKLTLLLFPVILSAACVSAVWPGHSAVRQSVMEALEYE